MSTATANLIPEVGTASDETLVSALVVLTHKIHGGPKAEKPRLRVERDLVCSEILRRMGGTR